MIYRGQMLATCPNGHPLQPGHVLVGWSPCGCEAALANHRGHRTVQCLDCHDSGETMVCYDPPHPVGAGHPNR